MRKGAKSFIFQMACKPACTRWLMFQFEIEGYRLILLEQKKSSIHRTSKRRVECKFFSTLSGFFCEKETKINNFKSFFFVVVGLEFSMLLLVPFKICQQQPVHHFGVPLILEQERVSHNQPANKQTVKARANQTKQQAPVPSERLLVWLGSLRHHVPWRRTRSTRKSTDWQLLAKGETRVL